MVKMNPTLLAETRLLDAEGNEQAEWIESSDFSSKEAFALSLEDEGYIVIGISSEDEIRLY